MNAITRKTYGSPDVLELREVDIPEISADQVLVRVGAAGVNQSDYLATRGWPYIARLMGWGLRKPKQPILGTDLAGRVEAVGSAVEGLQRGDEVFGWGSGTFANYAAVPENNLVTKPTNVTVDQAAAIPTAAITALHAIRDKGQVEVDQHVLVIGASGGVGTFAVQIAKAFGAEVTAVCAPSAVDLVRSTGADHVIDYTRDDFTHHRAAFDVIIDMVGNRSLRECRRALCRKGTFVVVGGQNPHSLTGMSRFAKAALMSPFVGQRFRPLFSMPSHDDLAVLKNLIEAGKLLPVIDRHYDLSDTAEALRDLEHGHPRGKVLIGP